MRATRLLSLTLAIAAAAPALAQISDEEKSDVLRSMDRVMREQAFVPGIDLRQWRQFIDQRADAVDRARTQASFARIVNGALNEFGISHINLRFSPAVRPEAFRTMPGSPSAQQGPGERVATDLIRWIDEDTALIRIHSFNEGYRPRHVDSLFEEARTARALVLDLRGNGGGRVENMHHLLSLLLPDGTTVGTFVSRRTAMEYERAVGEARDPIAIANWTDRKFRVRSGRTPAFEGEVAVLMDSRSASASEIVAGALRDVRRSPLVGTRSAGAVLMSTYQRLPHGFMMQFPISDYVAINGQRLEGNPLQPDVVLSPQAARSNAAVEAALVAVARRSARALWHPFPL
jgi:hypothetical protein